MIKVIEYKVFGQERQTHYAIVTPFGVKPFGELRALAISAAGRSASSCRVLSGNKTLKEFSSIHRITRSFFVEKTK